MMTCRWSSVSSEFMAEINASIITRCTDRRHVPHGRVVGWGEHEGKTSVAEAGGDLFVGRIEIDAQRLEHVGRAGFALGTIAVLGDFRSGGGCY